jgi:hypothetical protein
MQTQWASREAASTYLSHCELMGNKDQLAGISYRGASRSIETLVMALRRDLDWRDASGTSQPMDSEGHEQCEALLAKIKLLVTIRLGQKPWERKKQRPRHGFTRNHVESQSFCGQSLLLSQRRQDMVREGSAMDAKPLGRLSSLLAGSDA